MITLRSVTVLFLRLWAAATLASQLSGAAIYASTILPTMLESMKLGNGFSAEHEDRARDMFIGWAALFGGQFVVMVALCVGAWIYAPRIAAVFTKDEGPVLVNGSLPVDRVVALGSFLIGLYFFVSHLPGAVVQPIMLAVDLVTERSSARPRELGAAVEHVLIVALTWFVMAHSARIGRSFAGLNSK